MPALAVIAPHPDDEAYASGGTTALLARDGWDCTVVFVTSGEQGKRHDALPMADVAPAREAEAQASCAVLGAQAEFLRLPDGGLSDHPANPLTHLPSLHEADLLIAPGADGAYGHPDHLIVYRWALELVPATKSCLLFPAFPRGLFVPQYEKCLDMMGSPPHPPPDAIGTDEFDLAVDLSSVHDTKLASIAAHRTQLPGGDPRALFPTGIVEALLDTERFVAADSRSRDFARKALARWLTG